MRSCSTYVDTVGKGNWKKDGKIANSMEQHTLKIVDNRLNTNIYSYLETPDGQSSNLYLNTVHFCSFLKSDIFLQ
jgi:hypothetical protein